MNLEELNRIVSLGESVERELKSDRGQGINDKTIYEEVVALANTDGGVLLIGVEDDGQVTGAKPRHGDTTEPRKLQSAIFNNTVPNINTRISVVDHDEGNILCIEVDSYHLASELYRRFGSTAGYVRAKGFDEVQRRQMVLNAIEAEGKITRGQVMELCLLNRSLAYQLLKKMINDGDLEKHGETKGAYYTKKRAN